MAETDRNLTQTVLNVFPFQVAILDPSGTIVRTNRAWDDVDPDDGLTAGSIDSNYPERLDRIGRAAAADAADQLRALLAGEMDDLVVEYSTDHPSRSDWTQWWLLRATAFDTDEGRFAAVSNVEVTDQKRTSAELELKERAMDEAPVGITISDPDTEDNGLIYVNDAFERITGYTAEEALGQNCRFLQGEDTREEAVDRMRRAIDNEEPAVVEVRNYRKNGQQFWNEVTIAPLHDEDGTLTNFLGFQRDITARKEAQLDLAVERDRLALLNQVVRHDIRNDMAVVLGWGDHLREQLPEEHEQDIDRILDAARHSKQLTESVRDLIDLLGDKDPTLESINLADIVREEVDRARSGLENRSESVIITGVEEIPEDVTVAATELLSSVFNNLITNAIFHNDKDDIRIDISTALRDSTVVIRIADNGPGISDERKRTVFGQGEKGLESPGSGLGLYLVDNLVETYGGSVWVEDNNPEGAVFCVELLRV